MSHTAGLGHSSTTNNKRSAPTSLGAGERGAALPSSRSINAPIPKAAIEGEGEGQEEPGRAEEGARARRAQDPAGRALCATVCGRARWTLGGVRCTTPGRRRPERSHSSCDGVRVRPLQHAALRRRSDTALVRRRALLHRVRHTDRTARPASSRQCTI